MPVNHGFQEMKANQAEKAGKSLDFARNTAKEAIRQYANSQGEGWSHHDRKDTMSSRLNDMGVMGGSWWDESKDDPHTKWIEQAGGEGSTRKRAKMDGDDWGRIADHYTRLLDDRFARKGEGEKAPGNALQGKSADGTLTPATNSNHLTHAKELAHAWNERSQGERAEETFNPEAYNKDSWDARNEERPTDDDRNHDVAPTTNTAINEDLGNLSAINTKEPFKLLDTKNI